MRPRAGQRPGTPGEYDRYLELAWLGYQTDWWVYTQQRAFGVAREVARANLPTGIYTSAYMTANLQALLNLIGLRTYDPAALFVSYPQPEIEEVAAKIERHVAESIASYAHEVFDGIGAGGRTRAVALVIVGRRVHRDRPTPFPAAIRS